MSGLPVSLILAQAPVRYLRVEEVGKRLDSFQRIATQECDPVLVPVVEKGMMVSFEKGGDPMAQLAASGRSREGWVGRYIALSRYVYQ